MAKTAKKRKFSAAHRKAISEAAKKRWVGKGKKRSSKLGSKRGSKRELNKVSALDSPDTLVSSMRVVSAIINSDLDETNKVKVLQILSNL